MENNIIILEDENGVEIEFETLDVYELEGHTFFALAECLPEEEEQDEETREQEDENNGWAGWLDGWLSR